MNTKQSAADLRDLGVKIREARRKKRMTLEDLAKASAVSKSVLSQVERGGTNPTLSTLWNIAGALSLDPAELFGGSRLRGRAESHAENVIDTVDDPVIENDRFKYRLVILNKPELAGKTELYKLHLDSGGALESQPHAAGTTEKVTVLHGKVEVRSGNSKKLITAGQSARYTADVPHAIVEKDGKSADVLMLVVFT